MAITHVSAPSSAPVVEFAGVSCRYGPVLALHDLNLSIGAGETVALLGPNGAGKTTAVGLMLGLLHPTSGRVRTLGVAPRAAIASGRVGAMLQSSGLPMSARLGELVDFVRGVYPDPLPRGVILDRSRLASFVDRSLDQLSGGEMQRVRFALAIAGDPDLVFLDEPTVAMDVETRRAFWEDMRRSADEGRTILFATHYLDEADHVADRVIVLDRGRVVADGSGASIRAGITGRTLRFSLPLESGGDDQLATMPGVTGVERRGTSVALMSSDSDATVRALVSGDLAFTNLEVTGAALEDAFVALTTAEGPTAPPPNEE